MTKRFEESEVWICDDCRLYLANAELDPNKSEEEIENYLNRVDLTNYACGNSEKNDEFSTYPCPACNSKLAGARFHAIVLEPIEED